MQPRFRHDVTVFAIKKPAHSVEREPNPASPACLICRFARTAFLLRVGTLSPKVQIASPAPAAKKKLRPKVSSGKLFLMDNSTPTPNAQPTPQADKIGLLPFASFSCRQGSPCKPPQYDSSPGCNQDCAKEHLHATPAHYVNGLEPVVLSQGFRQYSAPTPSVTCVRGVNPVPLARLQRNG